MSTQARNQGDAGGLRLHGKMFWTWFKTIGHSLKNLGPSKKTFRLPWCPKLVMGLCVRHSKMTYVTLREFSEFCKNFTG